MLKIAIPSSFQRVLVGMMFGFVLGVVLYQSSRVQMQESPILHASGISDACKECTACHNACGINPTPACAAGCDPICAACTVTTSACPTDQQLSGGICCPLGAVNHDGTCYHPCTAPGYCENEPGCVCGGSESSAPSSSSGNYCCNSANQCVSVNNNPPPDDCTNQGGFCGGTCYGGKSCLPSGTGCACL